VPPRVHRRGLDAAARDGTGRHGARFGAGEMAEARSRRGETARGPHVAGRDGTEMPGTSRRCVPSRGGPGQPGAPVVACSVYPNKQRTEDGASSRLRHLPHVTVTFPPSPAPLREGPAVLPTPPSQTRSARRRPAPGVELYRRIGTVSLHRRCCASRCGAFLPHSESNPPRATLRPTVWRLSFAWSKKGSTGDSAIPAARRNPRPLPTRPDHFGGGLSLPGSPPKWLGPPEPHPRWREPLPVPPQRPNPHPSLRTAGVPTPRARAPRTRW